MSDRYAQAARHAHDEDDEDEEATGPKPATDSAFVDRQLLENRTLMVFGPIDDRLARRCTERLLVMEYADPEAPVTVVINSPGGSADSGFALYDMLRFVRPSVRTIVNGLCASAGILVHLAGEKGQRYALPESRFMMHQPSTAGHGTASDLDITAQQVIKLRERYIRIIAQATGRDAERILEDARRDFWLNSAEALEYGMIDKVIHTRSDLPE